MIPIKVLKYLIKKAIIDAEALIKGKRYAASIYIGGYAIEVALKSKICKTLHFNVGFPETKQELNGYLKQINQNNPQPLTINIKDIRNHNLQTLLFYSGAEAKIKNLFLNEWAMVSNWNPEQRYKKQRIIKSRSESFLKAVKKLIKEIA